VGKAIQQPLETRFAQHQGEPRADGANIGTGKTALVGGWRPKHRRDDGHTRSRERNLTRILLFHYSRYQKRKHGKHTIFESEHRL
jgi:hypothetical protein